MQRVKTKGEMWKVVKIEAKGFEIESGKEKIVLKINDKIKS